jgi:uncharacterized membrane protein YczE
MIMGIGISFILVAQVGYGPWDIFYSNFVDLFDTTFVVVHSITSIIVVIAGYIMRKIKPDWQILIITAAAAFMALWIDIFSEMPTPEQVWLGYLMLISGLFLLAIGINIARFTQVILPAFEFFLQSIKLKTSLSYGRIKQISEAIVFVVAVGIGFIFDLPFRVGFGTIIIIFGGGYFINLTYKPIKKLLQRGAK